MDKSSNSARKSKSPKPYPGFPLTPHPSGRWCKKRTYHVSIDGESKSKGKLYYFGKIDDGWEKALERFNFEWPYLNDGRTPPSADTGDGCTLQLLCNAFLTSKKSKLDSGELSPHTFGQYRRTTDCIIAAFGKERRVDDLRSEDFRALREKLSERLGMVGLRSEVNCVRMVFKFAYDERLIDRPVVYGQSFDRPSAKSIRQARNATGPKMFQAAELKRIMAACDVPTKAMVLLAANCGFGNTDVASLPQSAVDLKTGWIEFARPKTEIDRRIPLWKETVAALKAAIKARPAAQTPADDKLVFLTANGRPWVRVQASKKHAAQSSEATGQVMTPIDALSQKFAKLLKSLDINSHRNFYAIRHSFETIGGESKDQVAVNAIMGHVDTSMAANYRHGVSDERLRAVTETVHLWLFGGKR